MVNINILLHNFTILYHYLLQLLQSYGDNYRHEFIYNGQIVYTKPFGYTKKGVPYKELLHHLLERTDI
jgi:hypothetical protein